MSAINHPKTPITEDDARLLLAEEKRRAQKDLAHLGSDKWKKKLALIVVVAVVIMVIVTITVSLLRQDKSGSTTRKRSDTNTIFIT